jgi:type IV secretion system protein VirD4
MLMADDTTYGLAVLLDNRGETIPKLAYQEIASFLQTTEVTRSGMLAVAQSYIRGLVGERVRRSLVKSTFSLADVVAGKPLSIYLVIPPDKLESHRVLLKLWVGTLLKAIFSRTRRPQRRTLFLLDEAACLDSFPYMEPLHALSAGFGVVVHTFWQDLSQLQSLYPICWRNILNNCGVLQTFGFHNKALAEQWSGFLHHSSRELLALKSDQQVLSIHGAEEQIARRLNYLHEPMFRGMFDPNEFFADQDIAPGINR